MKIVGEAKPYHLCFETLANDLRIKILNELEKQPLSVQELAKRVNAERSTVSHSLKTLKECSYVDAKKQGKEMVYSMIPNVLTDINSASPSNGRFKFMDSHIENFCCNDCKKIRL